MTLDEALRARETRFPIGCRVHWSAYAQTQCSPILLAKGGTVTGYPRAPDMLFVHVDGNKHPSRYHVEFWEPDAVGEGPP
jgi:hypothetical protein